MSYVNKSAKITAERFDTIVPFGFALLRLFRIRENLSLLTGREVLSYGKAHREPVSTLLPQVFKYTPFTPAAQGT